MTLRLPRLNVYYYSVFIRYSNRPMMIVSGTRNGCVLIKFSFINSVAREATKPPRINKRITNIFYTWRNNI